jgi:hypothetical protein
MQSNKSVFERYTNSVLLHSIYSKRRSVSFFEMEPQKQVRVLYPYISPAIERCSGKFPRTRPHPECTMPGFMAEVIFRTKSNFLLFRFS